VSDMEFILSDFTARKRKCCTLREKRLIKAIVYVAHRVRRRIERTRRDLLSRSAGTVRGVPGLGAKGGKITENEKYFLSAYLSHAIM
jgi:hypothetical protein